MNQTIILIIYLSNKPKTTWRKLFVVHIVSRDRIGIHQIGSTMTCRWAAFRNVWIMLWSPIVAKFMGSHQIRFSGDDSKKKYYSCLLNIMYRHTRALCTIFTILLTLWNSEHKNGLLIKLFCFSSDFDETWWNCSTHG